MSLRAVREALLGRAELQGDDFCAAYARAADAWLSDLVAQATDDLDGLALVATGGYGRGLLAPCSDLDVVLVHRARRDVEAVAQAVWYPVWDEGVRLDHSVRSPAEVLHMAGTDLRVALGLLDGRLVVGDATVAQPLLARAHEMWRTGAARALPVLARQVDLRHHQHGDVAFLLEPDLKEAHGGLRDVDALRAALAGLPALARQVDLAGVEAGRRILVACRVELHRRAGRATDRLLLQEQDAVAASLGYPDADALMAAVSAAGRGIAWASDEAWRRAVAGGGGRRADGVGAGGDRGAAGWAPGRRRGFGGFGIGGIGGRGRRTPAARRAPGAPVGPGDAASAGTVTVLEPGVGIRGGSGAGAEPGLGAEVVLVTDGGDDGAPPAVGLERALRVAAVAAEHDLPIARSTLEELATGAGAPPDPWPDALRQQFVRVLRTGPPAVGALEALDQVGLLVTLLPEWAAVRNRPQRNAYHRFTVDRHLLEAAAGAAGLADDVDRPDLLVLGALLHDIGKGRGGDHTEVGIELVSSIGPRLGLPPGDVAVLVRLVRHHLLLADVATRRDLDDPATAAGVAAAVGDRRTLDLLAALTEADSLATGPAAWGTWKAGLVADLVRRTAALLEGGTAPAPRVAGENERALMAAVRGRGADGGVTVVAEEPRVTVAAPDRPGLLATVTGVLALHGLDVRAADALGEDGVALEVFTLEAGGGRWPDWRRVEADIGAALGGHLALEERLARRAEAYAGRRRPAAPGDGTAQVTIDNGASAASTVVEVRATDAVGLLHRVTQALFDAELDVVSARVSTLGHEVVDAFYVRDPRTGAKIEEPAKLHRIEVAVRAATGATGPVGATSARGDTP